MNIDDLIEYESENTCLDFKSKEYGNDKTSLLKDIMSMANANSTDKKYIIIGVKDIPGSDREIIGLDRISDQANLENIVQENIEPTINFKYYPYYYKEKMVGIIEIDNNANPPYMMKKDMSSLKKGDMWIRKGSRQSRIVREDIDRMFSVRSNTIDSQKIKIGIGNNLDSEKTITIPEIDKEKLPSNIEKIRLQNLLNRLKKFENGELEIKNDITKQYLFSEYRPSEKAIQIGNNSLGMPIYNDEKTLKSRIKKASENFYDEDFYFFFEENSVKLNFSILNNTDVFLEDVKVQFKIDSQVFVVSNHLPQKPNYSEFGNRIPSFANNAYPEVEDREDYYVIVEYFENIRHKEIIQIFSEDIRCVFNKDYKRKETSIEYELSARNLVNPIKGELMLNWS